MKARKETVESYDTTARERPTTVRSLPMRQGFASVPWPANEDYLARIQAGISAEKTRRAWVNRPYREKENGAVFTELDVLY